MPPKGDCVSRPRPPGLSFRERAALPAPAAPPPLEATQESADAFGANTASKQRHRNPFQFMGALWITTVKILARAAGLTLTTRYGPGTGLSSALAQFCNPLQGEHITITGSLRWQTGKGPARRFCIVPLLPKSIPTPGPSLFTSLLFAVSLLCPSYYKNRDYHPSFKHHREK